MAQRTQAERTALTRGRLLEAARSAFTARGYEAASLDVVCARAGCTKGALYHHFGSKAGLLVALVDDHFARRLAEAQASSGERPSTAMPFDRDAAVLFLEFVCAASRDRDLGERLAHHLGELRARTAAVLGDDELPALVGALANGASIEALVFGERRGADVLDAGLARLTQ